MEAEERKFLHDIASPVGTAIFVLDMLLESMKERTDANTDDIKQAQQVYASLDKIKKNDRRASQHTDSTGKPK